VGNFGGLESIVGLLWHNAMVRISIYSYDFWLCSPTWQTPFAHIPKRNPRSNFRSSLSWNDSIISKALWCNGLHAWGIFKIYLIFKVYIESIFRGHSSNLCRAVSFILLVGLKIRFLSITTALNVN